MNRHSSPLHTIGLASSCLNSFNGSNTKSSNSSSKHMKPKNNHHYSISYQNYHFFNQFDNLSDSDYLDDSLSLTSPNGKKNYDYQLKFLIVGDSDVGKEEILNGLENDNTELQFIDNSLGINYRSTTIFVDGKRIKIQLWDASGQGRFSTIIRSYSRGAQGILLVYDITNKWSFSSLNRWLQEVEEHAPGCPKVLIGNRLHLAFKRQINIQTAESYAKKNNMSFFEISPLCNYNIKESFAELSRIVLKRHGMDNYPWKNNSVLSLQEICCRSIVSNNTVYSIENLPIPNSLKYCLKSYLSLSSYHPNKKYIYSYKCSHPKNCINHSSLKKKAKSLFSSMFKLNT